MINFDKFELDNGLRVLVHENRRTPLVAVNLLYDVGSKDELADKTGFAHLFEHLMFSGSLHVPDFDGPIQNAGGENNAFTNSDFTNFYNILPAKNMEVAFWLESDRMLQLAFSESSLEVQKKVVIEEFKETTLNKPYGDIWHKISALAYKDHPYKWPTIGLDPQHIADATLEDVKDFFYKHYRPNNAILSVAGNTDLKEVQALTKKWFGPIPPSQSRARNLQQEQLQSENREDVFNSEVPSDALYMAFPMPGRVHKDFPTIDLMSDILSEGKSSRLYKHIVKKANSFSQLYGYLSGTLDPGLFIIDGKLLPEAEIQTAHDLVWEQLNQLKKKEIDPNELQKVKNKYISSIAFSDVSVLNKAINLAFYELLGDANMINEQLAHYEAVTSEGILRCANQIFDTNKLNTVKYIKKAEAIK